LITKRVIKHTTIFISAEDLQTFLDDDNYTIESIDVQWSNYGSSTPSVELSVNRDFTLEVEDYVDASEHNELKEELENTKEELENTKDELALKEEQLALDTVEFETEKARLELEIEILKQQLAIKPWYAKVFG
jgi:predicted  nucleic acid-binding Zn-ribbon protein